MHSKSKILKNYKLSKKCQRQTNRWTLNVFFYILDVCAYNSFVLHRLKFPDFYKNKNNRERLFSLETLCLELIQASVISRDEHFLKKNYHGVSSSLVETIKKTTSSISDFLSPGKVFNKSIPCDSPTQDRKSARCKLCVYHKNSTKYRHRCIDCSQPMCPGHTVTICTECKQKKY